MLIWHFFNIY